MATKEDNEMQMLMNMSLNDLADMPETKPYPNGAFRVAMKSLVAKKIGDNPSFVATLSLVEVVEMADPSAVPPAVGDEAVLMFNMANEFGQGSMKNFITPLFKKFGGNNFGELYQNMMGQDFVIVNKIRVDEKKDRIYMGIQKVLTD